MDGPALIKLVRSGGPGVRILHIAEVGEDEDILCRLTVRMADEGFVAIALQSPRAALDLLAGEAQANPLIADVLMPEMKGPRFVRLARELRPTLPVLLVS